MNLSEPLKTPIRPWLCIQEGWALIKDQYWLFLGITLVGMFLMSAVPIVLMGPMMCGIYLCYFTKMRGQTVTFDLLFKGFDWFVPGLLLALMIMAISMVVILPCYFIMFFFMFGIIGAAEQGGSAAPVGFMMAGMVLVYLVVYLLMLAVSLLFLFSFQLMTDRNCGPMDALKYSIRGVLRNFWGVLGLMLLNALLGLVGVLACYVGAFFIMPILYGAMVVAYRRVFPEPEAPPVPVAG